MRKEEKIEFRCTADLKRRLLACRRSLGTRAISDTGTALVLAAIGMLEGRQADFSAPRLGEVALHLDRIASALQRCQLSGVPVDEQLREVEITLARLGEMLKR